MSNSEHQTPPPHPKAGGESKDTRPSLTKIAKKVKESAAPMESSKQHFEQQQPAVSGAVSNMQRLRGHSSATAAELREFLSQLKGRSPQEVMGIVAQSSLIQGITRATIGTAVLLVAFTIIPYAISGGPASDAQKKQPAAASGKAPEDAAAQPQASETVAADATATPAQPDLKRAAEAMGIDGTANPDSDTNPLDKKLDKLLDGIE